MRRWQDNIFFVLIEPKEPGNVGASARAIKNMGFINLCLVKPQYEMTEEGRWFARNAHDVLDSAQIYGTLADAIRDKAIVVGTTRRIGKKRGLIFPVEQGVRTIFERASQNDTIAILFGRESKGLLNEEVAECGFLLTIPCSKIQPSLNLSHAVLITSYELSKAEFVSQSPVSLAGSSLSQTSSMGLVPHEALSNLYEKISSILQRIEYIPTGDRNIEKKIMTNLKHFIGRAGLTDWELKMLHGLCSQIEKKTLKK
jgi:TrmH family RNA methyltransferase